MNATLEMQRFAEIQAVWHGVQEPEIANGELGYPWPCLECGRPFTPQFIRTRHVAQFARRCAECTIAEMAAMFTGQP